MKIRKMVLVMKGNSDIREILMNGDESDFPDEDKKDGFSDEGVKLETSDNEELEARPRDVGLPVAPVSPTPGPSSPRPVAQQNPNTWLELMLSNKH
ncbi:hypothetical protein J6590_094241 [Homalodisca vitripennis]|nr:hypothetical protein J6590_094241 [Homalodisca vitripennis]